MQRENWDWDEVAKNPFFAPDAEAAGRFADYLDDIRRAGSSVGAVIEVVAEGVPAGWGAPIYGKLDAELAARADEHQRGQGGGDRRRFRGGGADGEENADEMRAGNGGPRFLSNHAGGILGGIATGQPIVARFAVKPTSSILTPRLTVTSAGEETEIVTKGRHDPCVGIRAVPVGEAMMACVLADAFLRHRAQVGSGPAVAAAGDQANPLPACGVRGPKLPRNAPTRRTSAGSPTCSPLPDPTARYRLCCRNRSG